MAYPMRGQNAGVRVTGKSGVGSGVVVVIVNLQ